LQQGDTKCPFGGGELLGLCRRRRSRLLGGSTILDVRAPVRFMGVNTAL
jgi:hypothetical protein